VFTGFAACLRKNGIDVPEPNTSGHGPIFGKGLDTSSPRFRAAVKQCRPVLVAALRAQAGAAHRGAAGGAAGAGAH
jgi:hypothetical protein